MIYLGLWSSHDAPSRSVNLVEHLRQYVDGEAKFLATQNLVIAYGKQSSLNDMDQVLESGSSILIGRIFDKETCKTIGQSEFQNSSQKRGTNFAQKVWGKYVYWNIEDPHKLSIMVDSTGQLPCFYYALSSGDIFFSSHIRLIQQYIGSSLEYDWSYLCSYLFYGNSSAIQSPFKGVEEIPPGCVLNISPDMREVKPFWNPFETYQKITPSQGDAVDVLQSVLKPMIEPYENVCVSLSGGLDSSSIVYCLKDLIRPDQKLSALNYFHSTVKSSNELPHARKVCEEVGIHLTEVDCSNTLPFDPFSAYSKLKFNKPFPGCVSLASISEIPRHLPSNGSCILLSGHGSDHIFMRPPTQKCIADYWLIQGNVGLANKLKEITHFYRDSLTPILTQNISSLIRYLFTNPYKKRKNTTSQDKPPRWLKSRLNWYKTNEFVHPAYRSVPLRILPGKYVQIDALYEGLASVHVASDACYTEQYPFFCEPVVNFAFSFPTYDLFQEGYDRYPLRQAVSSRFQTNTVWRRDKSETTGILQLGVKRNIDFVMELCLNGEMVKQGFVDQEGLRQTILLISNGDHHHLWPFIQIASIEIFLKMWSTQSS